MGFGTPANPHEKECGEIDGSAYVIVGHITVTELRRLLTETQSANGFANRFLWVCARRSKLLPEGGRIHEVDLGPLIRDLSEAVKFARSTDEVKRDEGARLSGSMSTSR